MEFKEYKLIIQTQQQIAYNYAAAPRLYDMAKQIKHIFIIVIFCVFWNTFKTSTGKGLRMFRE